MIMKNKKLLLIIFVVFALFTLSFVAYKFLNKNGETSQGVIIANFNDGVVTTEDVNIQIRKLSFQNQQLANISFDDLNPEQQQTIINEVVMQKIVYQKAMEANYHQDKMFQESVKQYKMDLLKQKYLSEIAKAKITDEALQNQYDKLLEAFKDKEDLRLRYIIVDKQTDADSIHAKLVKAPNSFADLAKANSIDEQSAKNGGDIGFIIEDALPAEILTNSKDLNQGQISDVFLVSDKWMIVKLEERRPAKINNFKDAKDGLAQTMARKNVQEFVKETLANANIVIVN